MVSKPTDCHQHWVNQGLLCLEAPIEPPPLALSRDTKSGFEYTTTVLYTSVGQRQQLPVSRPTACHSRGSSLKHRTPIQTPHIKVLTEREQAIPLLRRLAPTQSQAIQGQGNLPEHA